MVQPARRFLVRFVISSCRMTLLTDSKTETVAEIIKGSFREPIRRILVVGCGDGSEAAILAQRLKADVTGIDLHGEFDASAAGYCDLRKGDATALEFETGEFDFIFSYHALEHIEPPEKALAEMQRVLSSGGGFWVGTPNKSRLVGYVGGKNTSLAEKVRWNIADWRTRFAGRFENRFGAHAGFTADELRLLLVSVFVEVNDRTSDYYRHIYRSRHALITAIESMGLAHRVFPSIYFSGRR